MKIEINEKDIPFQLENEELIQDLLPSIKQYLLEEGHLILDILLDDQPYTPEDNERMISSIGLLHIKSVAILELEEAIHRAKKLLVHIQTGEGCSSGCTLNIFVWAKSVEFWLQNFSLSSEFFTMLASLSTYIAGGEINYEGIEDKDEFYQKSLQVVIRCLEERNLELEEPLQTMHHSMQALVEKEQAMRDLGVALQSHQDATSAYEILLLVEAIHKIRRVNLLLPEAYQSIQDKIYLWLNTMAQFMPQLIDAFDRKDFVLVSDLAEYEIAERLAILQEIMNEFLEQVES